MQRRRLGGLEVSAIGLGRATMTPFHRVYRGIRGPSADAIGMTPAKAERVCIDSPLEGTGFKLPVPGRNRMAFRGLARSAPGIGAADVLGSLPDSPLEGNGFEPSVPRCA